MRFAFIATEKACYPVALMCRVLKVSRAGYYAWCKRPTAQHTLSAIMCNSPLSYHLKLPPLEQLED